MYQYEYNKYDSRLGEIVHHVSRPHTLCRRQVYSDIYANYRDYKFIYGMNMQDMQISLRYYVTRYYNPRYSIWLSVDPMHSERSWLTPYNYVQNNPVNLIDPDGMLDDEWNLNVETGEVTKVSDIGGDEFQVINLIDNEGRQVGGGVIEGDRFYSGPIATNYDGDFTYGASSSDLWGDVPDEYLGHYTAKDLSIRNKATNEKGGLRIGSIRDQESMGLDRRDMIWNASDYRKAMINKYGTDASFVMAAEENMIPIPAGTLAGSATYTQRSLSIGKSSFFKSVPSTRGSHYFRNIPTATPKYNPRQMDNYLRNTSGGLGGM